MPKYRITMDYLDFQRLEKAKEELFELKRKLSGCIEYQTGLKPVADIKKLKKIALDCTDYKFSENEVLEK